MSVDSCLVHGREHASKFAATLSKLRCIQEFSEDIYRQLPHRCCSCHGVSDCDTIDIDSLRKLCLNLSALSMPKSNADDGTDDSTQIHWKKNKKKQQMKFDRQNDLKQQLLEYEDVWTYDYDEMDLPPRSTIVRSSTKQKKLEKKLEKKLKTSEKTKTKLAPSRDVIRRLESFQPIPVADGCVVHNRKYLAKFHHLLNLLRLVGDYPKEAYRNLPRSCCSCHERKGLDSLSPESLGEKCAEFRKRTVVQPEKLVDYVFLPYAPELSAITRSIIFGRFVTRDGQRIQQWQDEYKIRINIINESSYETTKKKLAELGLKNRSDAILLSFTKTDLAPADPVENEDIKKKILEAWDAASKDVPSDGLPRRRRIVRRLI